MRASDTGTRVLPPERQRVEEAERRRRREGQREEAPEQVAVEKALYFIRPGPHEAPANLYFFAVAERKRSYKTVAVERVRRAAAAVDDPRRAVHVERAAQVFRNHAGNEAQRLVELVSGVRGDQGRQRRGVNFLLRRRKRQDVVPRRRGLCRSRRCRGHRVQATRSQPLFHWQNGVDFNEQYRN